jgi:glutamine amidotransferase/cyclase
MPTVHLLDYVAGNVRSLVNAIEKVGYTVEWVKSPADVPSAEVCLVQSLASKHDQLTCALMQMPP